MKKEDLFPNDMRCFMKTNNVDLKEYLDIVRSKSVSCNEDFSFSKVYENFGQIDVERVDNETYQFKYKGVVYKIQSIILSYISDSEDLRDNFIINYLSEIDKLNQKISDLLNTAEKILYKDFLHINKEEYIAKLSKLMLLVDISDYRRNFIKSYFTGTYIDKIQRIIKYDSYDILPYRYDSVIIEFNSDYRLIPFNILYFLKDKDENFLYKYFSALFGNRYKRKG